MGEDTGQIGDAGALAVGGVEGQCQVSPLPQYRLDQTGQAGAGTHF